jgi:hypothetical protein
MNNLQKPTQQNSQWQQQLNDTMDAILHREKFSYDLNGDALFQQYKDQYTLGGQMAMQDTMGQASAMTGGYGNSYAQTVGQQQYQGYMQQLTDKIPELYQLALNAYNQETSDLYNRYGMLSDAEAQEYARYRDQMSDYYTDRDYLANQYYNERDFDYNKYVDDRNYQYQLDRDKVSDEQWQKQYDRDVLESDRQYEYQLARDAVSDQRYDTEWQYKLERDAVDDGRYDQQWQYQLDRDAVDDKWRETEWQYKLDRDKVNDEWLQKQFDEGVRQFNVSTAEDQRQANLNYELSKKKISNDSGGGIVSEDDVKPNSGNGWNNGKLTQEQVKQLQEYYGVTADGKWGSKSSAKANGMTADEAWNEYQNLLYGTVDISPYDKVRNMVSEGKTLVQTREYINDLYEAKGISTAEYRHLYDFCYKILEEEEAKKQLKVYNEHIKKQYEKGKKAKEESTTAPSKK